MSFLPWWAGALALASVPALSWLLFGQMLAVSGRVTALVDRARARLRPPPPEDQQLSPDELAAALAAATAAEFGLEPQAALASAPTHIDSAAPRPFPLHHVLFFGGLLLGGTISAAAAGTPQRGLGLGGARFAALFGDSAARQGLVLLGGGFLVGLGTRMSGGCTSGHGLCGVSRLQPGSLASTASFLGAAVLASLLLERLP